MQKEIVCKHCGNDNDFTEETLSIFLVDGQGNRESKVNEANKYICNDCGEQASEVEEYDVVLVERLSKIVRVRAVSKEDAKEKVNIAYKKEIVVLGCEDFDSCDVESVQPAILSVEPSQRIADEDVEE